MSFVNVTSFVVLSGVVLVTFALFLWLARTPRRAWLAWVGLALVLLAIHLALRTGGSSLTTPEQVEAALRSGKPTLLEFYSDL
jgi:hypothetical protein